MKVYAVGYADVNATQVVESLMMSNPSTLIIDIRYSPGSAMRAEWRKSALEAKYGPRYRWAGAYLGNVNYRQRDAGIKLANPGVGIRGLLTYLAEGHDLIVVCACKLYEQCHRKTVIDLLLEQDQTVEVVHPCGAAASPLRALSILQPYASMLAHPGLLEAVGVPAKRLENRDWHSSYRGPLLLHASKKFDVKALPSWSRRFPKLLDIMPLDQSQYELGGIVGIADLVDVVDASADPWFCGRYGFVLENARPLSFVPCPGQPVLFSVSADVVSDQVVGRVSK